MYAGDPIIVVNCENMMVIIVIFILTIDTDVPARLLDRVGMFSRPVKFHPLPPPL